jgi:hypothetical protein
MEIDKLKKIIQEVYDKKEITPAFTEAALDHFEPLVALAEWVGKGSPADKNQTSKGGPSKRFMDGFMLYMRVVRIPDTLQEGGV